MRSASHLYRNRYGTFYFRCVVPKELRGTYPNCPREIRRSLATQDQRLALRKAQVCGFLLEAMFDRLKGPRMSNTNLFLGIQKLLAQPGMLQIEGLTLDPQRPEEELKLFQGVLANGTTTIEPIPTLPKFGTEKLSAVINAYCDEQRRISQWTEKSEKENRAIYKIFLEIVGDMEFRNLRFDELRQYKNALLKLPPNLNKDRALRGLEMKECTQSLLG